MVNLAEPILKLFKKSSVPEISVGDIVRVHQKIREGDKERIQVFEGIVIAKHGRTSLDSTFTVRKIASGVGVERVYLLHSPNIVKIEFKRGSQVRRAKLYYLRALSGKSLRMKDRKTNKVAWEEVLGGADDVQTEATETDIAEAVAAEEAKQEEMAATESTADDGATSSTEGTMETEVKASETNAEVSVVSQETHHEPTDAGGESAADQPAADDKPADADNRTVDSGDGA